MALKITHDFSVVEEAIEDIIRSEDSYYLSHSSILSGERDYPTIDEFSPFGISSMGTQLGFPCGSFSNLIDNSCDDIANEIVRRYTDKYLLRERKRNTADERSIFVRTFGSKIYGFLSDRYSVFDDDEVWDIVSNDPYIQENTNSIWYDISPERMHLRFIDKEKFTIDGDNSPLSIAVFVENSMVGACSFKIRYGIYRHACTNGMIFGLKEFTLLKEVHRGIKDWNSVFALAMAEIPHIKNIIKDRIKMMQNAKSAVYGLDEEKTLTYIKSKLTVSTKLAEKIVDIYKNVYGGETKWDLCNAICHADLLNTVSIDTRLQLEEKALTVA